MFKQAFLTAAIAATLGATAVPASAATIITIAPPAPRHEIVPPDRAGYTWSPGYWDYRGHRHVWVAGQWMRDRRGYAYHAPQWVENNGRWTLQRGNWARGDRDGDGVPNGADRRPNNPNRS